jgi:hypothetical protein
MCLPGKNIYIIKCKILELKKLAAKQLVVVTSYTKGNRKDVAFFCTCSMNATTNTVIKRVAVSNS